MIKTFPKYVYVRINKDGDDDFLECVEEIEQLEEGRFATYQFVDSAEKHDTFAIKNVTKRKKT
mgnify:CR=1 FL=1